MTTQKLKLSRLEQYLSKAAWIPESSEDTSDYKLNY